ncbi:MAG: hypothetical protein FWG36_06785 [Oscillospiraceae bacterium]|nr:hypothetical protein [Oscillospiraceae bacterium]
MNGFIKGVGIGMAAGAAITMAVVPVDKRRMMKSPMGKSYKTICGMCDSIRDAF